MHIPHEAIRHEVLPSGLSVVTLHHPQAYAVSAGIHVRTGSRYEKPAEMGVCHLIEHMLFKGSPRYNAQEVTHLLEGEGGQINAYTSQDSTCYYIKTLPDAFAQSMDVLFDVFTSPLFAKEELEKERLVIIEEILAYEDQPLSQLEESFSRLLWGDHPLGNPILGTRETLDALDAAALHTFHKKHYTAENIVLSVVGAASHDVVMEWIHAHEALLPSGSRNTYLPYEHQQEAPRFLFQEKDLEQCYFQLGFPCVHRHHPDSWTLRVLNALVAESMSSRLYQEIREKLGYAYHLTSDVDFLDDTGCFSLEIACDARNLTRCVEKSMNVLQDLCKNPPSKEEVNRAKKYVMGCAIQEMESSLSSMIYLGDALLAGEAHFSTRYFCEQIENVSPAAVQEVASKTLIRKNCNAVVLGPSVNLQTIHQLLEMHEEPHH